ncbi:WYL domain-containing protein [Polymorphobacter multimanifer]|uniref:Putative DNA-binding transcriptional regulator YafY n=1 Tax=Polymorphobacter multimanifer TaxID=1070431 RepID=A0A841L8N4_9SPHN|nr:WYL domain-containing protein [Polymorphobacter multimanifer]MBB6228790.1 putative DNA-binding transcriptional regulator YafY [Polymorphobacter multimanifer]GGI73343.1 WYL domain-containing protein [Polymorphobacter multimanifer]
MRYARADRLIQLALEMQAARGGLTLTDIEQRFDVSRRTAIRMRDAVIAAFPQADEVPSNDRAKRWRLSGGAVRPLLGITADDLASLENAAALLIRENLVDQADELRGVASKIRASLAAELMRRIDPDFGALAEAEGLAMRPGPRPAIPASLFATLRTAIKSCRKVTFQYAGRISGTQAPRTVRPLGFLYGHRHYLVAQNDDAAAARAPVRFFSMPQITKLRLLPDNFDRDPDFNLRAFVAPSFGVYEEAPVDVVWRFSAEAAPIARQFQFHPSQTAEAGDDGTLFVRFHAGGLLEMAWHLMTWGRHVEVLAPQALRDLLPETMPNWPALP